MAMCFYVLVLGHAASLLGTSLKLQTIIFFVPKPQGPPGLDCLTNQFSCGLNDDLRYDWEAK